MRKFLATASVLALIAAAPAWAENPASAPKGSVAYQPTTSSGAQTNANNNNTAAADTAASPGNAGNTGAASQQSAQTSNGASAGSSDQNTNATGATPPTNKTAATSTPSSGGTSANTASKAGTNSQPANTGANSNAQAANANPNGSGQTSPTAAMPTNEAANSTATGKQPISTEDRNFVKQALGAGMAEVQEGQLALTRARDLAVQEFGRWMVTDHKLLGKMLKWQAKEAGMTLQPAMSPQEDATLAKLKAATGPAFEQQYVIGQVAAHQQAVQLFTQEANSGQNQGIKALAGLGLNVLKQHLAEAQQLQGALPEIVAASSK
jgi:putative membrane protein